MANRSSFLLAVLFIANPFLLLFYQNCSSQNHMKSMAQKPAIPHKAPASVVNKAEFK